MPEYNEKKIERWKKKETQSVWDSKIMCYIYFVRTAKIWNAFEQMQPLEHMTRIKTKRSTYIFEFTFFFRGKQTADRTE